MNNPISSFRILALTAAIFSTLCTTMAAIAMPVISEINYDQSGGENEFIELYAANGPADLTGWTVTDGGDEESFTFAHSDSRFSCPEPFVLAQGERLVLWQGSGSPVCEGPARQLFTNGSPFLQRNGDAVLLLAGDASCRDYVAYENGAGPIPTDCSWTGPNPSNGNLKGVSISLLDTGTTLDTTHGSDWERSGATISSGPTSPGKPNAFFLDTDADGIADSSDNCPAISNPDQIDTDGDLLGDSCDSCPNDFSNDTDHDGVCGDLDNCPLVTNPDQIDTDGNGIGDNCQPTDPPPSPNPVPAPVPAPGAGTLIITEIHYDQDSSGPEFIELLATSGPLDITGWTVSDQEDMAFTFAQSDSRFACPEPFLLSQGETLILWQGNGTPVCNGPVRHLFTNGSTFLSRSGDDIALMDNTGACIDYTAYETGSSVSPPPAGCTWTGPNPSNNNQQGTSISRVDLAGSPPGAGSGANWEVSGSVLTIGPISPGKANQHIILVDNDGDGVTDSADNCPFTSNFTQKDSDGDALGDACDTCPNDPSNDADRDDVCGDRDNCPLASNPDQTDSNTNGVGDACETSLCPAPDADTDNDGICDSVDNCPLAGNPTQADTDGNGVGDTCQAATPPPAPTGGSLLISEVHYDQNSSGPEFIELLAADGPIDITGWTVTDQEDMSFTFTRTDSRFPCQEPFLLDQGDRLVVWQGSGKAICTGPVRQIFLATSTFLQRSGDDITLLDNLAVCRDYVAYASGSNITPPPAGCSWTGPNPSNGDTSGVSISRLDGSGTLDHDSGLDWETSGSSLTAGPTTPGRANQNIAPSDSDGDGIADQTDNCPTVANASQTDSDRDGAGNACDSCPDDPANDSDGDGLCSTADNCPTTFNPDQIDSDGDGDGDLCDLCPTSTTDSDGDGLCDSADNCPDLYNPEQTDTDADAIGNACDACPFDHTNDLDGDGLCAMADNCPTVFNPDQTDADGDGIGDLCRQLLQTVEIPLLEQDIRSDTPEMAQHNQQSTSRIGTRSGTVYRSLGHLDNSSLPANSLVHQATVVYHTTSSDPDGVATNGDSEQAGGDLIAELSAVLKPWNYDQPLVLPDDNSTADNHKSAGPGDTSWLFAAYPDQWQQPGANGPDDHGPTLTETVVAATNDTMIAFTSPELTSLVQNWIDRPANNHGILIKASAVDETDLTETRKIFAGKGFPLETSTRLSTEEAISHRPYVVIHFFPY